MLRPDGGGGGRHAFSSSKIYEWAPVRVVFEINSTRVSAL